MFFPPQGVKSPESVRIIQKNSIFIWLKISSHFFFKSSPSATHHHSHSHHHYCSNNINTLTSNNDKKEISGKAGKKWKKIGITYCSWRSKKSHCKKTKIKIAQIRKTGGVKRSMSITIFFSFFSFLSFFPPLSSSHSSHGYGKTWQRRVPGRK